MPTPSGARSLVIGVANTGGVLKPEWIPGLVEGMEAGLDIVSGMHGRLASSRELKATAERLGRKLIDVRQPPAHIPVGNGRKRTGKRLLTVGTDCALGKKYTALALAGAIRRHGFETDFRATGQTGIMIAGSGIPMDAVVSDFVAGAAEMLSPDAAAITGTSSKARARSFIPLMQACRSDSCTAASRMSSSSAMSRAANTCSAIPISQRRSCLRRLQFTSGWARSRIRKSVARA